MFSVVRRDHIGILAVLCAVALGFLFGPIGVLIVAGGVAVAVLAGRFAQIASLGPTETIETSVVVKVDSSHFSSGIGYWVFAAALVRLVLVPVLNLSPLWWSFAPDAQFWSFTGELVYEHWMGRTPDAHWMFGETGTIPFYSVVNAVAYAVLGETRITMSVLNGAISIVAAFVFAQIAQELHGTRVARFTFILIALFPSIAVWTSMNIREAWALLAIGLFQLALFRMRRSFSVINAIVLLASVAWMYTIRGYLVPLLVGGALLSLVVVRLRQIPYAVATLFVMAVFLRVYGEQLGIDIDLISVDSLEQTHEMRRNLAYGGSAYGLDVDTRTLAGALAYLPMGTLYFLCLPFPWAVSSTRQLLTIPESLVWYFLLYHALRELVLSVRKYLNDAAGLIFPTLLITLAYGLVSGNEGTAYRHRAQIVPICLIFAAASLCRSYGMARGRARKETGPAGQAALLSSRS